MTNSQIPKKFQVIALLGLCIVISGILYFWIKNANQPLIDAWFRQSQTAMSAKWFNFGNPISGIFNYETPEFGPPWKIPMEFPLYQMIVAYASKWTGFPLTDCGRMVSGIFSLLTLVPIYSLCLGLGFGRRFFYVSAFLLLGSPIFLFYSRMFLIESTSVFLGFVFLAFLEKALRKDAVVLWVCAAVAAVLCGLVKATTFPSFGLAGIGIVSLKKGVYFKWSELSKPAFNALAKLALVGAVTVICVAWWTHHCDAIKTSADMTKGLTSNSLSHWNFGTLEQKLDWRAWRDLLFHRTTKMVFGWSWVLGFFIATATLLRGRYLFIFCWFVGLFLMPMLVFTNLHFVHPYYQTANATWLILAFAWSLVWWGRLVDWRLFATMMFCIFCSLLFSFYRGDYGRTQIKQNDAVKVGEYIRETTSIKSSVLVYGDDWAPEVALYAERRAYYIPSWISKPNALEIFKQVGIENLEWPIRAIVHRSAPLGGYSQEINNHFQDFLNNLEPSAQKSEIGEYDVFLLK